MLRALGVDTDEDEMAALCLTRRDRGTLDLGLYRGLNLKLAEAAPGLRVRLVRLDFDDLRHAPKPLIVRVRIGLDHTVVVLAASEDQIGRRGRGP